jgi:hypothetical protein
VTFNRAFQNERIETAYQSTRARKKMKLWTDLLCRLVEKKIRSIKRVTEKKHKIKRDEEKMVEIERKQSLKLHTR